MTLWAAYAAHNVFSARLAPVMKKIRQGMLPITLMLVGFAPILSGAAARERSAASEIMRDEISLDEAVRRAEAQYRARVVRTDVQDEDGRKVYVLKLLSEDGKVINVRIDAATGRMR